MQRQPTAAIPRRWLALLVTAVLVAHLLVLRGTTLALHTAGANSVRPLATRMLEATKANPSAEPAAPPEPLRATAARPQPTRPTGSHTPLFDQISPEAPVSQGPIATNSVANDSSIPAVAPHEAASAAVAPTPQSLSPTTPATAPGAGNESTAASGPPPVTTPVLKTAVAGPVRLKYEVEIATRGITNRVEAELLWQRDGVNYEARFGLRHWLLGERIQTSRGQVGEGGLAPERFSDKVRSELAAHFDRDQARIVFSANTPQVPLLPGAQDRLSLFLQLGAMLAGDPARFTAGSTITLPVVGPRSADSWLFAVGAEENLNLPGGAVRAVKLARQAQQTYDQTLEIWLAPTMDYLPVRIRLTEANGDVADQRWKASQSP